MSTITHVRKQFDKILAMSEKVFVPTMITMDVAEAVNTCRNEMESIYTVASVYLSMYKTTLTTPLSVNMEYRSKFKLIEASHNTYDIGDIMPILLEFLSTLLLAGRTEMDTLDKLIASINNADSQLSGYNFPFIDAYIEMSHIYSVDFLMRLCNYIITSSGRGHDKLTAVPSPYFRLSEDPLKFSEFFYLNKLHVEEYMKCYGNLRNVVDTRKIHTNKVVIFDLTGQSKQEMENIFRFLIRMLVSTKKKQ